MSERIDVVLLSINDAGMRIYEWLCDYDRVFVHSILPTKNQLQVINDVQPEYVVSCGYRDIIPEDILNIPVEG
jgi:methionyl-tRNA formyltransferase